jgi:hypothetical protein
VNLAGSTAYRWNELPLGLEDPLGQRRGIARLQKRVAKKNNTVALSKTTVSDPLDAFGNYIRGKRSELSSAIKSKLNQASSPEFIRLSHDRPELKKSQKRREEFIKIPE